MTRETKIGLLVGLAFILIVGVLLSDHVATAARPPEAELASAAEDARRATRTPGAAAVMPGLAPSPAPTPAGEPFSLEAVTGVVPPGLVAALAPAPPPLPEAEAVAAVVPVIPEAQEATAAGDPWAGVAAGRSAEAANEVREYVARPGDSLSRIVRREMGADTPEHRHAVLALNPRLRADPDLIVAGRTYLLPATPADAAALATTPAESSPAASPAASPTEYEVRPGDSLWKIADAQADGPGAVPAVIEAIRALNPDALAGDTVRVGTTLRLPPSS